MFDKAFKKRLGNASEREVLSNFRSENWSKLSTGKRILIAQEVENRNATAQGRQPCIVKPSGNVEDYGQYNSQSNVIYLNVNDRTRDGCTNNSYQVLDTIYHEGEHAHQDNCVANKIDLPQGLHKTTRDMCEIENYRVTSQNIDKGTAHGNIGDLYNYRKQIDYSKCTCEIDSNTVAVKKVMDNRDVFLGDPEYGEYLSDRAKYFEKVNLVDMNEVRKQQGRAVDESLDRGDIANAQRYEELKNEIWNGKEQPAFVEAQKLPEVIRQELLENSAKIATNRDSAQHEEHTSLKIGRVEDCNQEAVEAEEPRLKSGNEENDIISTQEQSYFDEEQEQGVKRR